MSLSELIKEYSQGDLKLSVKSNEILTIQFESQSFDYNTQVFSKAILHNLLSFISTILTTKVFKIISLDKEDIYLRYDKYDMYIEISIDDNDIPLGLYAKLLDMTDTIERILSENKNVRIQGIHKEQKILVQNDNWQSNIFFDYEDIDSFVQEIDMFFNYRYTENQCLLGEDYIEYIIDFPELKSIFGYIHLPEVFNSEFSDDKINYEITKVSLPLYNLIVKDQEYGDEEQYENHWNLSLKIFNINKVLTISHQDTNFIETALKITKSFLFKLSMKYDINISIAEESVYEIDAEDIVFNLSEKLEMINPSDLIYNNEYDEELVQYYYQASLMEDSPFKYLAYYQVIECIYDEVLMENTIGDIQQLITSKWFNSNDKSDIQKIIEKIKWHNNSKKDEDKLRLIMEKYFRNNASDDVFLEVNKEIVELCKKMKIIKENSEFKDLQKIQKKIYRYRCDCTHSNRMYPISKVEDGNSIQDYIKLIKLIAERIILNYQ